MKRLLSNDTYLCGLIVVALTLCAASIGGKIGLALIIMGIVVAIVFVLTMGLRPRRGAPSETHTDSRS